MGKYTGKRVKNGWVDIPGTNLHRFQTKIWTHSGGSVKSPFKEIGLELKMFEATSGIQETGEWIEIEF